MGVMISEVSYLIDAARREHATELDLSGQNLTELPESIGQLTRLETLNLSNNRLAGLPESIGQLTSLRRLHLGYNQLTELPKVLGHLTQLKDLTAANNLLTEVPEFIPRLTRLRFLFLTRNQLTGLPESIGQLTRLLSLSLSRNRLAGLPESIGQLTSLRRLHLGYNQLTELPESIGGLTQLNFAYLNNNQLQALPESLGLLRRLAHLHLEGNQLKQLPAALQTLTSLKKLYLHGNDALSLPAEVLGPSRDDVRRQRNTPAKPAEILEYYFRVRGGRRPLNEAKLILVGRGAVGKTSVVNRLVYNVFVAGEKKTEGINITEWPLRLNEKEQVRLNVWDFGGQEIMHATHQFFLTQRSLYLLVLNGRDDLTDADADYWLRLIESFGGDSPVLVVLNKIREQPFDLNRRAIQQKYPSVREFIKTDCEDPAHGFEELRRAIERETDRLEHLRDPFPSSWFAIKDRLAGMGKLRGKKKNYLSFEEYRAVCARHGEADRAAQEALAGYLHTLGIALNYKDDPRLQDTHVLNPHWVTNGIYSILNAKKLEEEKGVIAFGDLADILDEAKYPRAMHPFIIDLMKKFELCFSFPEDDSRYLVPELLDKQQPEEAAEFRPEECLNFQYHYTVLPEGLLPRFIVRTHARSEGLPRWRTGVILEFEGCRALVKADVPDRRVFINVKGPAEHRPRLMAVVRSYLEGIHDHIPRLQPQAMVPIPGYPNVVIPYEKLLAFKRAGIRTCPELADGVVIVPVVQEMLNGIDLQDAPRQHGRQESGHESRREAMRLFISYSHRDATLRKELEIHLKVLQREGLVETWQDRRIKAGDEWKKKIDENLERADIILLLVSADFIASDYCYEEEMRRAMERHRDGEARVLPIIARDVDWMPAEFAGLQVLPEDGKPVTRWRPKDKAWRSVAEKIRATVEEMRERSGQPFQI